MLQWTSTELARRSGIHGRTICKLEKGEAQPQRKTLAAIVGALSAAASNSLMAAFGSRAVNAKTEFSVASGCIRARRSRRAYKRSESLQQCRSRLRDDRRTLGKHHTTPKRYHLRRN